VRAGAVIALDLGGTHASAGRIDPGSRRLEEFVRVGLPAGDNRRELLARIVAAATAVREDPLVGLGVAVPGPFDYENGVSLLTEKLEALNGVDLRRELGRALGLDGTAVTFVNDADAFLLGEWWAGSASGQQRAVGVTLGTGVGSAFLDEGRIVDTGPTVPPEGCLHLVTYRGRPLEETVSRRAMIAHYGDDSLDVHDLARLARGGDASAGGVFSVVAPWLVSFDATCLVVGGSIAKAWDLLRPGLREALAGLARLESIACASRIDEAALLGAAHVALLGNAQPISPLSS
jgi:glucokinase